MIKKIILIFLAFWCSTAYGQNTFLVLKKELEDQIAHSQFKVALALINKQDRKRFNSYQNIDLDVLKVKLLTEFGLYDESLKLSTKLISDPNLTDEQLVKTLVERELIFEINHNPKASKEALVKAEKIFEEHPELKPNNYTNFLIRKSSYYRVNGYKDTAFVIAQVAKKYADSIGDKLNMPVVELILGHGYKLSNPQKALMHFKRALALHKAVNHNEAIMAMYDLLANYLMSLKEYNSAHVYIDSAIANYQKSNVSLYKGDVFLTKSEILEHQNQPDSALKYYKLATGFFKESEAEQRDQKVRELNTEYEKKKAVSEKKLLTKNIKETEKLNITLVVLISVLALLFIGLILFLLTLAKNKRKIEIQRLKISQKNEALNIALNEKQFLVEELNHRVKNNLSVILSLISFQKEETESALYKNKFEDLYQRIKTIALAHELYAYNVNHNDHSQIELQEYTNKIFEAHQYDTSKKYIYEIQADAIALKVDKALPLGLILNELITNSIKHAQTQKNELVLNLKVRKTENDKIKVEYTDNGTVFNFNKGKNSLGIFIMEGMVKQLRGSYQRENANYKILFSL